jgi:hypothetical protein
MSVQLNTQHTIITSEELQAWLAEKTGALQDEMRDSMDMSDRRSQAKQSLGCIKADIAQAKGKEAWTKVRDELQTFIHDNKGNSEMDDAVELAQGIRNRIDKYLNNEGGNPMFPVKEPSDGAVEKWGDKLQAVADRLGNMDQLALIRIQDLNSRVSQATQLASNLVSSSNQALGSVVQNIKA